MPTRLLSSAMVLLALTVAGCGSSNSSADYRNSDSLAKAVKQQLSDEGRDVDQVVCIRAGSTFRFACAYKLTDGQAAVRNVRVAPDGKTWSEL